MLRIPFGATRAAESAWPFAVFGKIGRQRTIGRSGDHREGSGDLRIEAELSGGTGGRREEARGASRTHFLPTVRRKPKSSGSRNREGKASELASIADLAGDAESSNVSMRTGQGTGRSPRISEGTQGTDRGRKASAGTFSRNEPKPSPARDLNRAKWGPAAMPALIAFRDAGSRYGRPVPPMAP